MRSLSGLVYGHGLNFCLPPKTVCKEQLFAEFESLWVQLEHHKACSIDTRNALKAQLTDLAHSYSESQIEKHDFMMQNECYQAIKSLRRNEKILITRRDKGSGVVVLNKNDYVTKMGNILNDASKFKCLGPAATADRTATTATKLQNLGCFFFGHLSVIDRFFCAMTEIFLVCSVIITENFFTTANTIFAGS